MGQRESVLGILFESHEGCRQPGHVPPMRHELTAAAGETLNPFHLSARARKGQAMGLFMASWDRRYLFYNFLY
jgi:hypothetical protein